MTVYILLFVCSHVATNEIEPGQIIRVVILVLFVFNFFIIIRAVCFITKNTRCLTTEPNQEPWISYQVETYL